MTTRVGGFDWDNANRQKCQRHGVPVAEIESMFDAPVSVVPDRAHSRIEERFKAIGGTDKGRHVFVVFTLRRRSGATLIRPISAGKRWNTMKKPLPDFKTDEQAEKFVAEADLTDYDLSQMRLVRFEFQPKSERVNMRLPKALLDAVKDAAAKAGVPYQRFIRQALEAAVHSRE